MEGWQDETVWNKLKFSLQLKFSRGEEKDDKRKKFFATSGWWHIWHIWQKCTRPLGWDWLGIEKTISWDQLGLIPTLYHPKPQPFIPFVSKNEQFKTSNIPMMRRCSAILPHIFTTSSSSGFSPLCQKIQWHSTSDKSAMIQRCGQKILVKSVGGKFLNFVRHLCSRTWWNSKSVSKSHLLIFCHF